MKHQNLHPQLYLKLSLFFIILMIVQNFAIGQNIPVDKQGSIEIIGFVRNGKLLLNPSTQSLNKHKVYTFKVDIRNSFKVSKIIIKPKFTTKKTDIPDILKTYFIADNGTIVNLKSNRIKEDTIPHQYAEFNDIEIKGDYTSIEVTVIMLADTSKLIKAVDYGNRNYFKCFNFTTGFFCNTLVNTDYNLSSDGTKIIKEIGQKYDISIGALANFNYVVCPVFKAGIGLGAAISPVDTKLRFLFGPSFTLGSKNEFAISFGIAYAKLTVLSSSISTNGVDYNIPLSNISTTTTTNVQSTSATGVITNTQTITTTSVTNTFKSVPTYNKWDHGFFIGITYSLIKK